MNQERRSRKKIGASNAGEATVVNQGRHAAECKICLHPLRDEKITISLIGEVRLLSRSNTALRIARQSIGTLTLQDCFQRGNVTFEWLWRRSSNEPVRSKSTLGPSLVRSVLTPASTLPASGWSDPKGVDRNQLFDRMTVLEL